VIGLFVMLAAGGMFGAAFVVGRLLIHRLLRRSLRRPVTRPVPLHWAALIESQVPLVLRLNQAERERLLQKVHQLIDGRHWEGCGGLALTEKMQLSIAAQACLLVLEHAGEPYPGVKAILVYPSTFRPRRFSWTPSADTEFRSPLLGQAWQHGIVILAWDSVRAGAENPFDGQNVVFHEFAHELDAESGELDGSPRFTNRSAYVAWAGILEREYAQLLRDAEAGLPTVLDQYGATDRSEFFAVATEAFFEMPHLLKRKHPNLYDQLSSFYRQDPAARCAEPAPQPAQESLR
jgi:Mlc titration factor MtfA (ptsG expression regulator)